MTTDRSIAFVDDEERVLKALKRAFIQEPYEILTFNSPVTALRDMPEAGAAVVVSDQRMPEMEGIPFLKAVAQRWPDSVRIILTGYMDLGLVVSAINEGHIYYFLQKPWNDGELRETIVRAMEHYQTLRNKEVGQPSLQAARQEIHHAQQRARLLEVQALIDPLTQIPNRRAFDQRLTEEFHRFRRYGRTFSLALLDVDYFKVINDHYGHLAGDDCLKLIAGNIRQVIREVDFLARYGGDEFALILSNTSSGKLSLVLRRVLDSYDRRIFFSQGKPITPTTISAGGSEVDGHDTTELAVFQRADSALYQAKKAGRNQALVV
jgi:diguanylate cyclase (GGDEF)-like protein